jgi:hypothetical protein
MIWYNQRRGKMRVMSNEDGEEMFATGLSASPTSSLELIFKEFHEYMRSPH